MFKRRRLHLWLAIVLLVGSTLGATLIFTQKSSAAYTCLNGGDHGGAAWDPATDCPGGIAGNHTNIGALTIGTGETATVQAYSGTQYGSVQISASSATITGTLTADAKGYAGGSGAGVNGSGTGAGTGSSGAYGGGASYGGLGTKSSSGASAGPAYGSLTSPTDLGSGGGGSTAGAGGAGGGAIQLTISGTLTVNGTVTAGGGSNGNAGPGSGGTIFVTSGTFTGSGIIRANGGNGHTDCCAAGNSGQGGGGRIVISYSVANTFSGASPTVSGGTGGGSSGPAENGSMLIVDATNNDLYLTTSQTWRATSGFTVTYRNVNIQNSSTINLAGYYTTNTNGIGFTFNVSNFTLAAGSTINMDGLGYAGGSGTSISGAGPGAGGGSTTAYGGGGSYGGAGTPSTSGGGSAGAIYGSLTTPVDLGSGGGGSTQGAGGNGGGAIKIVASGTVTVNGTVSANGLSSGGNPGPGSGGSIYITSGTFTGSGTIRANGGNGHTDCCAAGGSGNGGGGRIAIYYSSANTFTGASPTVSGGTGGNGTGENGSAIIVDSTNNDLYIDSSQAWYASTASTYSYRNVYIQNSITWLLHGYYTTNTNGIGFTFNVSNFTLAAGSTINMDGLGYAGGSGTSISGAGPGAGGGSTTAYGGGGSYGGAGTSGTSGGGTAGATYGSATAPVDLGSGGGGSTQGAGGAGGGAIKVAASATVTINGTITANGLYSGGNPGSGSGGSIYITAKTMAGSGVLQANGGNGHTDCCGAGASGNGGGGRIAVYYDINGGYAVSTTTNGGTGGNGSGSPGVTTVQWLYHALADRSITMSSSAPGGTGVGYHVVFTPSMAMTIGGIVLDICDNDSTFNNASCTFPTGFDWGGATPSLTVNGGMGTGWTATGVQGGAGSGKSQVLELSNATPQSVTASTAIDFTITSVTNPTSSNHSFYARVLTFDTAGHMTSEYIVSGATRTGNLPDSKDHGGFALSTGAGISLTFTIPESLSFCVSGSSIGSNCSGVTTPSLTLGHGSPKVLNSTAVDKANAYTQTSTNASSGVVVRMGAVFGTTTGLANYRYDRPITVDNTAGGALTNYQVSVVIDTASLISTSKLKSDCSDIRFTDSDTTTLLNFWLESGCNTSTTQFWVKVPSISAGVIKTIYAYYGNVSAISASNGANTFDFFDDFSSLNGTVWGTTGSTSVSGGTATISTGSLYTKNPVASQNGELVEASLNWTSFNASQFAGLSEANAIGITGSNGNGTENSLFITNGSSAVDAWSNNAASAGYNGANGAAQFTATASTQYTLGMGMNGSNLYYYKNRTLTNSYANVWSAPFYISLGFYEGNQSGTNPANTVVDWVLVRKFASTPPATTVGSEVSDRCGGLSSNNGASCAIPAVNTSCAGSCSATAISAGTAAFGMCVAAGSGSITVTAPYNGASCGSGTMYGLDDATATNVRSLYGSQIFSSSGPLNQENDTLIFAATTSALTPGGLYTGNYTLIVTGTF